MFPFKLPALDKHGTDAGVLLLRVGAGLSLFVLFGLTKLHDAVGYVHTGQWQFVDFNRKVALPLPVVVAFIQTFNESVCALLVAFGLWTRLAATLLFIGFVTATACSLKVGEQAWLFAAYFSLMFATVGLVGGGRFSIDHLRKSRDAQARTRAAGK